jgi:outer membrane protein assembly factor BamB
VVALEAKTGKTEWVYHLPARADTSPALLAGLALVGCHDGWVYALRADTGELVWRTRIAPAERRMVAYGQLESTWPVVGGVLVAGNTAYAIAGRTTEADGGLYVAALEPATGRVLWLGRRYLNNPGKLDKPADHDRDEQFGAGASNLLCSDGKSVIIGAERTVKGRFECATGKDTGTYAGALLQFSSVPVVQTGKVSFVREFKKGKSGKPVASINKNGENTWKLEVENGKPVALAAAGDRLIVGVSTGVEAGANGELWVISTDGKKRAAYPLPAAPAYDGIAVAGGRVFVSLVDATVACLGKKN